MTSANAVAANPAAHAHADRRLAALLAAALGIVILYGAGFAPVGAVHNAAHDTRHSAAFPCH